MWDDIQAQMCLAMLTDNYYKWAQSAGPSVVLLVINFLLYVETILTHLYILCWQFIKIELYHIDIFMKYLIIYR